MSKYQKMAEELVEDWKADDGGLTYAATDVCALGARLDKLDAPTIWGTTEEYMSCIAAEQDVLDAAIADGIITLLTDEME